MRNPEGAGFIHEFVAAIPVLPATRDNVSTDERPKIRIGPELFCPSITGADTVPPLPQKLIPRREYVSFRNDRLLFDPRVSDARGVGTARIHMAGVAAARV